MITVRGQARAADGRIHADSRTKLITVLIYMNESWEAEGGRLRLLRSPDGLDDAVAEVPPAAGTLLAFLNTPHSWHGHSPVSGPRRVIQLNWVTSDAVVSARAPAPRPVGADEAAVLVFRLSPVPRKPIIWRRDAGVCRRRGVAARPGAAPCGWAPVPCPRRRQGCASARP